MTSRFSILVMIARYQSSDRGGGIAVHSQLIECSSQVEAERVLVALSRPQQREGVHGGRFVVDAIPLWS